MLSSWHELPQHFEQLVNAVIRFVKMQKREQAAFGLAALLFSLGFSCLEFFLPMRN